MSWRFAFSLLFALSLAACSGVETPADLPTASESICKTQFDCGSLGNETVAACVARLDAGFAALRAQDGCAPLADVFEELYACLGARTCSELKDGAEKGPCKSEYEAHQAKARELESRCSVK